ncbi:hypothetical protein PIB30_026454 [Stylosanthes scabra]|uniref:Uncharacterized protein n=1 Tax=Stylosanthes scabra TaxID=79078 RepID=A0ABU6VDH2_9FABA|nr:hypothetical protein [Stylosanthes scabra]
MAVMWLAPPRDRMGVCGEVSLSKAKGTSTQQPTIVLSTDDNDVHTPKTNMVDSSESVSTDSSAGGLKVRGAARFVPMPASFVTGSRRSKRLRMGTITQELKDINEFMSNQVFMKNPVGGAAGSPVVGSNSAGATPSR